VFKFISVWAVGLTVESSSLQGVLPHICMEFMAIGLITNEARGLAKRNVTNTPYSE
jgi:hypothetical protein